MRTDFIPLPTRNKKIADTRKRKYVGVFHSLCVLLKRPILTVAASLWNVVDKDSWIIAV